MTAEGGLLPLTTAATPAEWDWRVLDASRPRRALEHVSHSEVGPVTIDRLRSADVPASSSWALAREIPIVMMDSLDAYWAFERILSKLNGFGRTREDAKADLVNKLGGHLQLLSSLESPRMAPILRLELEFLRVALQPKGDMGS